MFNSTTLMEQEKGSPMLESASIESYVNENNDHWLYETLEYNDRMHENHVNSNIGLYRLMCEDARGLSTDLVIQEGVFANFIQRINKFIEDLIIHIHNFFARLFGRESAKSREEAKNDAKQTYEKAKKASSGYADPDSNEYKKYKTNTSSNSTSSQRKNYKFDDEKVEEKEFDVWKYTLLDPTALDKASVMQASQNLWIVISDIVDGKRTPESEYTDKDMKNLYRAFTRNLKGLNGENAKDVVDAESFKSFVRDKMCAKEKAKMTQPQYLAYTIDLLHQSEREVNISDVKEIERELKSLKDRVNGIKDSANIDQNAYKVAAANLSQLESMINCYIWYNKFAFDFCNKALINNKNTNEAMIKWLIDGVYIVVESSTIHGEEFNSDTLFANEDMRDFTPSEWLDLELTTETYQVKFELDNFKSRVALGEAQILSDEEPYKIKRLIAMREAEEKKVSNTIQAIFARIKEFVNKFFDKMKANHKVTADFINRNMDAINKPINPQNKYASRGDVLAGMYRVQDRISFIDFNYETMKDELKDKDEFFRRRVAPGMNKDSQYSKRRSELKPDNLSINEFCKAYYGASMPEDKFPKCEFTGEEFERNKQNIIKFLQRADSFLAGIRDDLRNLEDELKKVNPTAATNATSGGTPNATNGNPSTTSNNQQTSTQESYYSVLYGKYLTEMEIDNGGGDDKDGQGNGQKGMDQSGAFKAYMDVYKSVLLSKLTAAEFVISELSQVIRKHAMENMNSDQQKKENEIAEKNKALNGPKQNDNK